MKRFIIKGIAFLIIIVAMIKMCNWCYWRKNNIDHLERFQHVPEQIQICNVGASHSYFGFDYSDYENRYVTFNFALRAQSHTYDYNILKYYRNKLAKGGFVFMDISYSMIIGIDETEEEMFSSKNLRYYTFLPSDLIKQYDWESDLKMNFVPFIYSDSVKWLLSGLFQKGSEWENRTNVEEAERQADSASDAHVVIDKTDTEGNIIYQKKEINAIYKMITLCREEGMTPILITPPVTDAYIKKAREKAPEYCNQGFYDVISKIQEDTGVEYYDYSDDKRFAKNYSMFKDTDHMNKSGARKFTNIIMEEVVGDRLKK